MMREEEPDKYGLTRGDYPNSPYPRFRNKKELKAFTKKKRLEVIKNLKSDNK